MLQDMKPLRTVKLDPDDPDWTFPYARRATMEKILVYFENIKVDKTSWSVNKHTHALPAKVAAELRKTTRWPSVEPKYRQKVEDWFQMKLAQAKKERGELTAGKIRSLRMNAAVYGRFILTGKRRGDHGRYAQNKRLLFAYREHLHQEELRNAPKLQSRRLEVA